MNAARRALSVALALAAVAALGCTKQDNGNNTLAGEKPRTQTPAGGPQSTAPAANGGGILLEAKDNVFEPATVLATAGDVVITMRNTGVAPHTFTSTEFNVDVNADGGKTAEVRLTGVKPGTYTFICKYHEALKMVGQLKVS